jgi:hypothetical protein
MVTELDMSILPNAFGNTGADIATNFEYQQSLNPYTEGVPVEKMEEWDNRMLGFFQLFLNIPMQFHALPFGVFRMPLPGKTIFRCADVRIIRCFSIGTTSLKHCGQTD